MGNDPGEPTCCSMTRCRISSRPQSSVRPAALGLRAFSGSSCRPGTRGSILPLDASQCKLAPNPEIIGMLSLQAAHGVPPCRPSPAGGITGGMVVRWRPYSIVGRIRRPKS